MLCPQCGELCNYLINEVCQNCDNENQRDIHQINNLRQAGHSDHCSRRIVWGDGECECGLKNLLRRIRENRTSETGKTENE